MYSSSVLKTINEKLKNVLKIFLEINIIATMAMVLFSCENSLEKVKQFISTDTISGLLAYDVVITRSDSGNIIAKLSAPVMHNIEGDSGMLEFPKGFLALMYDNSTDPTSSIRADYGISYEDKKLIIAKNNVVVENKETQEMLNTETLFWDRQRKIIRTACMVKITSPDKIIFGDSLEADEDFSHRVIHGIRATIEMEDEE